MSNRQTEAIVDNVYSEENLILLGEIYQLICICHSKKEDMRGYSKYLWRTICKYYKQISEDKRTSTIKQLVIIKINELINRLTKEELAYLGKNDPPDNKVKYFELGRSMFK